ncbi:MAG: methylphosphotriester-DNA--protein-cysteine methyltransferase family protein [Marinicaulis sp.]|nr:methylphosphotriester-DNA--protein-cysteine methyltransferase family protein [Marinicaulis sp.]
MDQFAEWDAARKRCDPKYDGVFFIAVKTTKIYCRPVCRVRSPLRKNITFFPSAAACEQNGFRPCLRCRPETAPFSPAWKGTRSTVERALKLIQKGALNEMNVEALANKLGVGARHLSRLFNEHIGASPTAVAKTMRIQKAKRLLDETTLPMTEVAFRAGFCSLSRFNAVFKETYKRSPSEIRSGQAN